MNKYLTTSFDPRKNSLDNLMAIVFPKSTSASYPLSLMIAQGALKYAESIIGTKLFHMAVFSMTKEDVKKALALLNYIYGLKGISIFMNGLSYPNPYTFYIILGCYLNAMNCDDYRAYCHTVIDDPFKEFAWPIKISIPIEVTDGSYKDNKPTIIERYLFPCKYLYSYFRFQKGHPSLIKDQIQAAGIDHYCEWCPSFHPDEFVKLPTKIIYPDGTVVIEPNQNKSI